MPQLLPLTLESINIIFLSNVPNWLLYSTMQTVFRTQKVSVNIVRVQLFQKKLFLFFFHQGHPRDASQTGGVEVQRLGQSPWRCSSQQCNSRQRPKLLHGEYLYTLYSLSNCSIQLKVYYNIFDVMVCPQNEPTFYTEDGTPFTAADPGLRTLLFL